MAGDIPLLGYLFKRSGSSESQMERMFADHAGWCRKQPTASPQPSPTEPWSNAWQRCPRIAYRYRQPAQGARVELVLDRLLLIGGDPNWDVVLADPVWQASNWRCWRRPAA